MKKILLVFSCILGFAILAPTGLNAQCSPDTSLNVPGIYPDTLADGCQGELYSEVINFVFPADTTVSTPLGTFTLPFDSFIVSSVTGIPAGMSFTCNISSCVYITNPPSLTNGCVNIFGTPTDTTASTDSVEVTGDAYVDLFGSPTAFPSVFKLGLKIHPVGDPSCAVSIDQELQSSTSLNIFPNPLEYGSVAEFSLSAAADVNVEMFNVYGKKVKDIYSGHQPAGKHSVQLFDGSLPSGLFFVKMTLDNGKAVITQKVLSVK